MSKGRRKVTVIKQSTVEQKTELVRMEGSCEHCGLEWQPQNFGSVRQCAFAEGKFGPNWNCGLVGEIRSAMRDQEDEPTGLRVRFDDQSFGALFVAVPETDPENWASDYQLMGLLVATWYKNRGACDELKWALPDRGVIGDEVTLDQALKIVAHLKVQEEAEMEAEARMAAPSTPAPTFAAHAAYLAGKNR